VGSNPTPSAKQEARTQMSAGFFMVSQLGSA
jgi:hypothetical protein